MHNMPDNFEEHSEDNKITADNYRDEIARRAYFKWREAGSPFGDGSEFWLAAEKECRKLMKKKEAAAGINHPPVPLQSEKRKPWWRRGLLERLINL